MSKSKTSRKFVPGRYTITSSENESEVLDLSGTDLKSLLVFPTHGGKNQQWEISPLGAGYSIKCLYNEGYITVDNSLKEGTMVVVTPYPVSWELEEDDFESGVWRICWPASHLILSGKTDGLRKIELATRHPFHPSHLWRFIPLESTYFAIKEDDVKASSTLIDEKSIDTPSTTKADTVIDAEGLKLGGNGELAITTTTTTTTVTVTRVKRLTP